MNIFDKMQLLKLLREYRQEAQENIVQDRLEEVSRSIDTITESVENRIRGWLNSGGGF